jgi:hypothetical protein
MRLCSLHPQFLEPQGLVARWPEELLASGVLRGSTRGYCFKLRSRSPAWLRRWREIDSPRPHPLFRIAAGPIANW